MVQWKDTEILVDNHERKSIQVLYDNFKIKMADMPIGDVSYRKYCVEIKIGADVHDYARMTDEFSRMAKTDLYLHAIYLGRKYNEYKIFVGLCQKYGIYAHNIFSLRKLPEKLKQIFRGKYKQAKTYIKKPTGNLTDFQRSIAAIRGLTEDFAMSCPVNSWAGFFKGADHVDLSVLLKWFGTNKNNKIKKNMKKFISYLHTGTFSV